MQSNYQAPRFTSISTIGSLLKGTNRVPLRRETLPLYWAGDSTLLQRRSVAIIGSRQATKEGLARARKLARQLVEAGVVVVSGLAEGIDTAAHTAAMEAGGKTIAVIGTPLYQAYPAQNGKLQERIWKDHLLITPFAPSAIVKKSNFPDRNLVMAALTDGTVVIEASDTSGTLHQTAECVKLGRWLFLLRSLVENPNVTWPASVASNPTTVIVDSAEDVLSRV